MNRLYIPFQLTKPLKIHCSLHKAELSELCCDMHFENCQLKIQPIIYPIMNPSVKATLTKIHINNTVNTYYNKENYKQFLYSCNLPFLNLC